MPLFGPPNIEKLKQKRDVSGLIKALAHKDPETRRKAAVALGDVGDPTAVERLIAALKDAIDHVRWGAAVGLGRLGDSRGVEPLVTALEDNNERVRLAAAYALGKLGDSRALEALTPALKHKDWFVRGEAAVFLGELGDPEAVRPLVVAMRDEYIEREKLVGKYQSEINRTGGWTPLGGSEAIRARRHEIESADVAAKAANALENIGAPAVEPLIASLRTTAKSKDWHVRFAVGHIVGEVLYRIGERQAVDLLVSALKDRDDDVRSAAACALEKLNDPQAVDPLTASLEDQNEEVRLAAKAALEGIGGQQAELAVAEQSARHK